MLLNIFIATPFLIGKIKYRSKDITRPANCHLFFPVEARLAFTSGTRNKPAEFPGLKLPGRALMLAFFGTFFHHPAGFSGFIFQLR
jgi:hypothetical protein